MAFAECGNGHIYNTDQYSTCPYCNGGGNQMVFNGGSSDVGKTVPAGAAMGGSDIGKTVPASSAMMDKPNIWNPAGDNSGKTVAPAAYNGGPAAGVKVTPASDIGKTVAVMQKSMSMEPVVGWFVCIDGPDKGKDFRILAKNNTIGRSEKNDICIKGDQSIARENQGRLGYDVKHNTFHIIPGESSNNIYIGEDPVYVPTKLDPYQVLEIGETKLVFVPFCGATFTWEDGMKE